ncbi:PKD domain-containing protein [Methanogenium cariaci]|uniref:PKD domain-containing protein n=1 Tax=Methanogenium cariaci TaxID=2197 RepID=UPI000AD594E3|nr:PKD domain-containing protein [Methanogenium cariaci]
MDLRCNNLDLTPGGSAAMTAIGTLSARGGVQVLYEPQVTPPALPANFTADVTEGGVAPLTVTFTDRTTGGPEEWCWEFGDGTTSTEQHPVHTYMTAGTRTVCLTVKNACGCDTTVHEDYIHVHAPHPTPVDEFPAGGGGIMVMVCGILGVAGGLLCGEMILHDPRTPCFCKNTAGTDAIVHFLERL